MARPACLICKEDYAEDTYLYAAVNGDSSRRACLDCLTTMTTRVIKNKSEFPIRLYQPGDLRPLDYPNFFEDAFIEQYKLKETEHKTFPKDRVYCECKKFIGRLVKLSDGETYLAIGTCKDPECGKKACLLCDTHLEQANLLAEIDDHGCKEKLAAKEADFQKIKDSDERGVKYQLCPTCSRSIQLSEACNHITCPCSTEFCYLCGKPATAYSGHWDQGPGSCSQWPRQNVFAQPDLPRGAIRGVIDRQIDWLTFGNNDGEEIDFELALPAPQVRGVEVINWDDNAAFRFGHVFVDEDDRGGYMVRRAARDANENRNRPGFNARAHDLRRFERALTELEAEALLHRTMAELEADIEDDQAAAEDDERRQGRPVSPPFRAPFAAHDQHRRMVAREDDRPVFPEANMLERVHVDANNTKRRRGLPQREPHAARTRQDARQPAQNNRPLTVPPHAERQPSQDKKPVAQLLTPPPAPRLHERVLQRLLPDTLRTRARAAVVEQRGRNHATVRRAVRPEERQIFHAPQGPQISPRRPHNEDGDGNGNA
jgi:hypothetical protein